MLNRWWVTFELLLGCFLSYCCCWVICWVHHTHYLLSPSKLHFILIDLSFELSQVFLSVRGILISRNFVSNAKNSCKTLGLQNQWQLDSSLAVFVHWTWFFHDQRFTLCYSNCVELKLEALRDGRRSNKKNWRLIDSVWPWLRVHAYLEALLIALNSK